MKKSIVISLLTVTTLFCTALCSLASTGIVTTDTLRLREEPSTESSILTLLSIDDKVEIIGEEDNGWYKVQSGDYIGYVAAQYINVLTETNGSNINTNTSTNKDTENGVAETPEPTSESTSEPTDTPEETESVENNKNEVAVLAEGEKIYITPIINSLAIDTLEEEKEIKIVSSVNGWTYIKIGTTTGWVRTQNIQKKEVDDTSKNQNKNTSSQKVGYITTDSVNFRKTPSTSGEIIAKLPRNAKVTIINEGESWSEIKYDENTGYVFNEYISKNSLDVSTRSASARTGKTTSNNQEEQAYTNTESGGVTGEEIISYAKQYLGYKYVSGGSSISGFDCSGFTTYVYKHFGILLSRTSSGQSSNGVGVSYENMKIGDIICFANSRGSNSIGHVGIYIGSGKFIHSANSRQGVIISNVSGDGYYFVTARRVI